MEKRKEDEKLAEELKKKDCIEYIELLSVKDIAKEYGKTEEWVSENHYVNLWKETSENGKGNKQLYAPNLVGLSDVYIVNQLIKYRDGIRGSGNGDKHGKVMQLFAKNLKNETVMKDIASYIISLQE